ncbi:MAG TPA: tripartite tricarboxylate transporter substrate binding protein [Roseomonas sp.]
MKHPSRRGLIAAAAAAALPLARSRPARAAAWPDKPVRLVVPFTPGGSTDILGRAMAQGLSEHFGQTFIIDNRAGAGGSVGSEMVVRAAPDGYTLMMGHIGTLAVNPAIYPNLPFDTVTAFQPIILVAKVANILAVNPRVADVADAGGLIALARRRPGELTFGSGGNGSAAHIAGVALQLATGIQLTHVPYRGTGPMMTDLMAGQIAMTMTGGPPILPPVRAGSLRAIGVSSLQRLTSEPGIPTLDEQGLRGFEAVQWYGLVGPAGMPREIVDRLNAAGAAILREPLLQSRLAAEGADAAPGTPESFGDFIRTERDRWGEVIRRAGVRAD